MVDELNHRVRNMLMVVNAIAQQTLTQARTPEEFSQSFAGRIQALGAAYGWCRARTGTTCRSAASSKNSSCRISWTSANAS